MIPQAFFEKNPFGYLFLKTGMVIKQKRVSNLHRTATTSYPCFLPNLGEFTGSWSYKTYPPAKVIL